MSQKDLCCLTAKAYTSLLPSVKEKYKRQIPLVSGAASGHPTQQRELVFSDSISFVNRSLEIRVDIASK